MEGVGSSIEKNESRIFYYTNSKKYETVFKKAKIEQLKEGIIMGQASALLVKSGATPVSCIFAETHTSLPDSKAAAEVIKALDAFLGLKIDYKPLLKIAAEFEKKFRGILMQGEKTKDLVARKQMSYVG